MRRARSHHRRRHGESGRRRVRRRDCSPLLRSASRSNDPVETGHSGWRRKRRRRSAYQDESDDGLRGSTGGGRGGRGSRRSPPQRSPPGRGGRGLSSVNALPLGPRREVSPERAQLDEPNLGESTARVWVQHSDCAKIIGKGGRALKQLEARTHTRLKVQREDEMDPTTKERYVDILGTESEHKVVLENVLELVAFCRDDEGRVLKDTRGTVNHSDNAPSGEPMICEVAPEEVGKVLGRGGETIKVIERDSGAKIDIDKASGKIEVFGEKEKQDRAIELLLVEVSFARDGSGTVLKDTRRTENGNNAAPLKFWVKDREAGKVIGRSGETVREVMDKTGADVRVQKSDDMPPGSKEREVTIYGTEESQKQALAMILEQSLTWARGEDGKMLKEPSPEPAPQPASAATKPEAGKAHSRRRRDEANGPEPSREQHVRSSRNGAKDSSRKHRHVAAAAAAAAAVAAAAAGAVRSASGLWVCATCGGDHRTKECPHSTGLLGVGMQIGMQMGMQAMGLPSMPVPPVPPLGPPLMGPQPVVPMLGLPGMTGALPLRRDRSSSEEYSYSSGDYSGSEESKTDRGCNHTGRRVQKSMPSAKLARRSHPEQDGSGGGSGGGRVGPTARSRSADAAKAEHLSKPPPPARQASRCKRERIEMGDL